MTLPYNRIFKWFRFKLSILQMNNPIIYWETRKATPCPHDQKHGVQREGDTSNGTDHSDHLHSVQFSVGRPFHHSPAGRRLGGDFPAGTAADSHLVHHIYFFHIFIFILPELEELAFDLGDIVPSFIVLASFLLFLYFCKCLIKWLEYLVKLRSILWILLCDFSTHRLLIAYYVIC